MDRKNYTMRLSVELMTKLVHIAKIDNRSLANLIETILRDYINNFKTLKP